MHTTTPTTPNSARRIRTAITAGAIGLLACGSLGACGASTPGAKTQRSTTTLAAKSSTTVPAKVTTTVQPQNTTSGGGSTGGNTGGNTGNSSGGGNTGGGTTTPGTAPKVTGFTTPENIDCHNGNSQMFTMKWTTENTSKVTISIDGPGIYDTYGSNDEVSLPFNCSSSHTFLLTAYGTDGSTITKQITLEPRNVQVPDMGNE